MIVEFAHGISLQGNTLIYTDSSIYTIGNEARGAVGIVSLAVWKVSTGDQVLMPVSYLAETVTTFQYDVTGKDGVFIGYFFTLPLYVAQTLVESDIYFDVPSRKVKKVIAGVLSIITEASLLSELVPWSGSKKSLVTTQICAIRDNLELLRLSRQQDVDQNCCEYHDFIKAQNDFNYVRALKSGARVDFCSGNYVNAQLKIERGIEFGQKVLSAANQ